MPFCMETFYPYIMFIKVIGVHKPFVEGMENV